MIYFEVMYTQISINIYIIEIDDKNLPRFLIYY